MALSRARTRQHPSSAQHQATTFQNRASPSSDSACSPLRRGVDSQREWYDKRQEAGTHISLEELENEALKLESYQRAMLAERLLNSLEALSPPEIERLWAEEALRRLEEVEQGTTKPRPAEEVFRDVRSRLG